MVDAADKPDRLLRALAGRPLTGVVTTHGHPDHWQALAAVLGKYPEAWFGGHPDDQPLFPQPLTRPLTGGEPIPLDQDRVEVIHTPGHTPGSICLRLGGLLFTGDTLFPGGPGATQPPLGDFATIMESLATKLFTLPDETVVLPGHGEATTIGAERPQLAAWAARGW